MFIACDNSFCAKRSLISWYMEPVRWGNSPLQFILLRSINIVCLTLLLSLFYASISVGNGFVPDCSSQFIMTRLDEYSSNYPNLTKLKF